MDLIWLTITIGILLHFLFSLFWINKSIGVLDNKILPENTETKQKNKIVLVIPLLREQEVVEALFNRFMELVKNEEDFYLTFVTTEREEIESMGKDEPTTNELLKRIKHDNHLIKDKFLHLHYPKFNSVVAYQLNYAVEKIISTFGEDTYIMFYNADSIINQSTFSMIKQALSVSQTTIFQQSSLFLHNVPELLNQRKILLSCFGVYQSYWTLRHEIPQYIFAKPYFKSLSKLPNNRLAYCVTHGLLIPAFALKEIGFIPNYSIGGEDLAMGYFLKLRKFDIRPLPVLENSETPKTWKALLNQIPNWFLATLGYFSFWSDRKRVGDKLFSIRNLTLAIQGLEHPIRWFIKGFLILAYFIISYIIGKFFLSFLIYFLVVTLPLIPLFRLWRRLPEIEFPKINSIQKIQIVSFYWIVPIVRSIPAIIGIWFAVKALFGKGYIKSKTE